MWQRCHGLASANYLSKIIGNHKLKKNIHRPTLDFTGKTKEMLIFNTSNKCMYLKKYFAPKTAFKNFQNIFR